MVVLSRLLLNANLADPAGTSPACCLRWPGLPKGGPEPRPIASPGCICLRQAAAEPQEFSSCGRTARSEFFPVPSRCLSCVSCRPNPKRFLCSRRLQSTYPFADLKPTFWTPFIKRCKHVSKLAANRSIDSIADPHMPFAAFRGYVYFRPSLTKPFSRKNLFLCQA